MKKFITIFLTGVLLCSANLWADRAGYTIKNYSFQGVYNSNNTVTVREIIDVNFDEPRHGIYRQIPDYFYLDVSLDPETSDVKEYITDVENFSAGNDPFTADVDGGYSVFKIGDADVEISGPKTYELTYTYVIPDDRTKEADFIYYSVLGAEWETTIDHFSFAMSFENGVPEDFEILSGDYGERENSCKVDYKVQGDTIYGSADNIEPNTAITLFTAVEEGYFTNEKKSHHAFIPWIFFVISVLYGIYGLMKCMKVQVKNPVQTVEFYPPDNILSSEVGTIIDDCADTEDIVSLIPYFAKKGYMEIHEEKDKLKTKTILKKLKDLPESSPEYQKIFFNGIFKEKDEVDVQSLGEDFAKDMVDARNELHDIFKGDKALYEGKTKAFSLPLLLCIITGLAIINDSAVEFLGNIGSYISPAIFLGASHLISYMSYKRHFQKKTFNFMIVLFGIVAAVCTVFYSWEISQRVVETIMPWWCSALMLVIDFGVCAFSYRLIIPTDWNVEVTGKLLGLREFINTAELPRLKALMDQNPEYFYDILPYAMVFGLTDKWADLFKNLDVHEPGWYHSTTHTMFNPSVLVHTIDSGISHSISSSVSKATASSGGGGFSGGGGGGGGGGSW